MLATTGNAGEGAAGTEIKRAAESHDAHSASARRSNARVWVMGHGRKPQPRRIKVDYRRRFDEVIEGDCAKARQLSPDKPSRARAVRRAILKLHPASVAQRVAQEAAGDSGSQQTKMTAADAIKNVSAAVQH